jgi:hypothetical protein
VLVVTGRQEAVSARREGNGLGMADTLEQPETRICYRLSVSSSPLFGWPRQASLQTSSNFWCNLVQALYKEDIEQA